MSISYVIELVALLSKKSQLVSIKAEDANIYLIFKYAVTMTMTR